MNNDFTKPILKPFVALVFLLSISTFTFAKKVIIGKNCYELDNKSMTAKLTFFDKKSKISNDCYLYEVVIPEVVNYHGRNYTVNEISEYCFWKNLDERLNLSALSRPGLTITIPKTIERIDENAFTFRDVIEFKVDPVSPYFTMKDNILYDKSFTKVIRACDDKITKTLDLPSTVKKIYPHAFSGQVHSDVAELVLPKGLEVIGDDAFSFFHVKTVVIPGGIKSIGARSFYRSHIEHLILEEGIETVDGHSAFDGFFKSIKLPKSLKRIEDGSFSWFTNDNDPVLTVYIPENVEYIGQCAFRGDNARFIVSPSNPYYSSDEDALFNKDKTQLLHVSLAAGKNYRVPASVTSIEGYNVFMHVDTLIIDHPLTSYQTKNRAKDVVRSKNYHDNLRYIKAIYALPSEISKIKKYNNNVHDLSELK